MLTPSLQAKLDQLAEYTRDLCEIRPHNLESFRSDKMLRRYAERVLHMAIETCISIGVQVLTDAGFREPENFHDVFIVLGDRGVLTPALVRSMTDLVELRNMLVYEHEAVDDTVVYAVLKKRVDDMQDFSHAIHALATGEPLVPEPMLEAEEGDLED